MSSQYSISEPFVRVSTSLAEKLRTDVISHDEFSVLIYMMLKADLNTGIITTKASLLAVEMGMDRVDIKNILGSLKRKGFIQNPAGNQHELNQAKGSTKCYPILICDYPVIESIPIAKPEHNQPQTKRSPRQKVTQMPQATENIETDGNLAIKTEAVHKNNNINNIYKLPPQTSISKSTGGEGDFSKTEEEIEYLAKQLRYHSVRPHKARQLAVRYPRDTIFRHIKQIKYDYCSGQRWGDPGAILVHRIQAEKETPNFE